MFLCLFLSVCIVQTLTLAHRHTRRCSLPLPLLRMMMMMMASCLTEDAQSRESRPVGSTPTQSVLSSFRQTERRFLSCDAQRQPKELIHHGAHHQFTPSHASGLCTMNATVTSYMLSFIPSVPGRIPPVKVSTPSHLLLPSSSHN